jgi:hypothetical protein
MEVTAFASFVFRRAAAFFLSSLARVRCADV